MNNDNIYVIEQLDNNEADKELLAQVINILNDDYPIPLTNKIDIRFYVKKILNQGFALVAKEKDTVIGLVTFYANNYETGEAVFSLLGVIEDYRKMGVAKILFENSFLVMKKEGMDTVFSYTHNKNHEAIKFHEKMGFEIDANRVTDQKYNISFIKKL